MKHILVSTLFFYITLSFDLHAQSKRDYQWIIGYDTSSLDLNGGAILLNFHENPRHISNFITVADFTMEGSNTSMCDELGNLLFYSNGCYIVNSKHEIMENGNGINPGIIENFYCDSGGSPLRQGVIAIPSSEGDSIYYVFNLDYDQPYLLEPNFYGVAPQRLYYQKIDMAQDSGFGAVVLKNQIAVLDTFARGYIKAVRHANGQDWWIIVPKSHSNCYFLVPITADGVQPAQLKCSGRVWTDDDSGAQVVFSPDGKKYIRFNGWNGLNIFDFDANTGDLSNPINILFPNDTINYIAGVAVSPNSRYLYVCARKNVYQFDLHATDIESSKIKVATWDGYQNPYSTLFYLAALAPDGKIYISNTSSTYDLHVINKPNCPGSSCELVQHGIVLPSYNFASIPNMPHYRQSYFECDSTLIGTMDINKSGGSLSIFPNPASETIYIPFDFEVEIAQIFAITGNEIVQTKPAYAEGHLSIDIRKLPTGLYYLSMLSKNKKWIGKFVKGD